MEDFVLSWLAMRSHHIQCQVAKYRSMHIIFYHWLILETKSRFCSSGLIIKWKNLGNVKIKKQVKIFPLQKNTPHRKPKKCETEFESINVWDVSFSILNKTGHTWWRVGIWGPFLSVCGTGRCRCRRGRVVSSKGCSSTKGRGEKGGGGGSRQRGSSSISGSAPFHKRPPLTIPSSNDDAVLDQCAVIEDSELIQASARYHRKTPHNTLIK